MFRSIMVLESTWDSESVDEASVWPFVSEFARAMDIRAFYRPFADKDSFRHWVQCFDKSGDVPKPKLLYVAAHGDRGRIGGLRRSINRKTVLTACRQAKTVQFVHFGSCLFGTAQNLSDLLKAAKQLKWVAGYAETVGWVDSTLFDVLLWGRMLGRREQSKGLHYQYVARALLEDSPGLSRGLGFRFQYRRGKSISGISAADTE